MTHPPAHDLNQSYGAALWLVSRERYPRAAREAWTSGLPATLRGGIHFDVVHLPAALIDRGLQGSKDRASTEAHFRAAGVTSAVIASRTRTRYSALVPPGTAQNWAEPGTDCLGADHHANYLPTPPPFRHEPPGAYWLLPAPDDESMLCNPVNLRLLIGRGKG